MLRKLSMVVGALAFTQLLSCNKCSRDAAEPTRAPVETTSAPEAGDDLVKVSGRDEPAVAPASGVADAAVLAGPPAAFREEAPDTEVDTPRDIPGSAEDTIRPGQRGAVWPPEDYQEAGAQEGQDDDEDAPAPEPLPIPDVRDAGTPDAPNPYEDSPVEPGRILDAGLPSPQ